MVAESKTPEYRTWHSIKDRCNRPNASNYSRYGGKGIKCLYKSYQEFLNDVGRKPTKSHSIDRIDNNLSYQPGNCKWATIEEQSKNRSTNRAVKQLTVKGDVVAEFSNMTDASEETGTSISQIFECCSHKFCNSKSGFVWRYKEDEYIYIKKPLSSLAREIDIYNSDRDYIKTVESACEAARQMGVTEHTVRNCIQKRYKKSKSGYLFRYKGEEI